MAFTLSWYFYNIRSCVFSLSPSAQCTAARTHQRVYILGLGQSAHVRVNGLDEGQACVTIRKVIGPPWAWIPPSRDSHATAAGIAQSACLEGSGSIHVPSCHTNTFFLTPIFVQSPDHHLDLLFTYLKTQLQKFRNAGRFMKIELNCGRKQRILLLTVNNFRIPYKEGYSLVRRATIRNSRRIPNLQS
jgi:hypothetical protein